MEKLKSTTKTGLVVVTTLILVAINVMMIFSRMSNIPDFGSIKNINQRKKQFFTYLLPKIEKVNNNASANHHYIWTLYKKHLRHKKFTHSEYKVLNTTYQDINYFQPNNKKDWDELLNGTGKMPNSFLLAEASYQSHNGTSTVFKKSRNIFNITCHATRCGVSFHQHHNNSPYLISEIKVFDSVQTSVGSYLTILNSNLRYDNLRRMRKMARNSKKYRNIDTFLKCNNKHQKKNGIANKEAICQIIKEYNLTQYDKW